MRKIAVALSKGGVGQDDDRRQPGGRAGAERDAAFC